MRNCSGLKIKQKKKKKKWREGLFLTQSSALIWFTLRAWRQGCKTSGCSTRLQPGGDLGMGDKRINRVLLFASRAASPYQPVHGHTERGLPAQLPPQSSPKISPTSKDRGRYSPKASSKSKFSFLKGIAKGLNPSLHFRFNSVIS